jgi:hypothetical protein
MVTLTDGYFAVKSVAAENDLRINWKNLAVNKTKQQPPLWSNWDVDVTPNDADSTLPREEKPAADLVIELQFLGERGAEANPRFPPLANPMQDRHGDYFAVAQLSYRCADFHDAVSGQVTCKGWPREASMKAARAAALTQIDDSLRKQIGAKLTREARKAANEKEGWYLHNPYPFVVEGTCRLAEPDKQPVPFRLTPGSKALWIDANSFSVQDLVLSRQDAFSPQR